MLSTIAQLSTTSAPQVQAQYAAGRRPDKTDEAAPVEGAAGQSDHVRLSGQALVASVRHESNREILTQFASAQANGAKQRGASAPLTFTVEQLESGHGKKIAAMFDELGIDLSEAAGIDHSAEATSDRIVDASTGMFATFARQNADLQGEDLIHAFEVMLHEAVDAGYGQAREALDGAAVNDEVVALGDQTMGLVHSKFDAFFEGLRAEADRT